MINSREEYRLWLLLKNLSDTKEQHFLTVDDNDKIMIKWVESLLEAIESARKTPFETITLNER